MGFRDIAWAYPMAPSSAAPIPSHRHPPCAVHPCPNNDRGTCRQPELISVDSDGVCKSGRIALVVHRMERGAS